MSGFYHGSRLRHVVQRSGFRLRQWLKRWKSRSKPKSEALTEGLKELDSRVASQDWEGLRSHIPVVAELARAEGDHSVTKSLAQALERLGDQRGASLLRLSRPRPQQNYWRGEDISARSLLIKLVEDNPRSLGHVIRHARLAGAAAKRARQATVLVEPRMQPILKRTFPFVDVASPGTAVTADLFATFEDLESAFALDARQLAADFVPLLADPDLTRQLRQRYRVGTAGPIIGLSWGSKSHNKDVPGFADWSSFIKDVQGRFVSLQYGHIDAALRRLRGSDKDKLIHDETVDQMVDMDAFAAQISALDAVVTISNTAAHLAGALGVPTVFIIDDKFHTAWPVLGDRTPWYPKGIVVRREGRAWRTVLEEVKLRIAALMHENSGSKASAASGSG